MKESQKLLESFQANLNESIDLPEGYETFTKWTKGKVNFETEDSCKINACYAYKNDNSESIYVGSVKADGVEITHFFNVKDGVVIDHSYTASKRDMSDYKGVNVSDVLTSKGFALYETATCSWQNKNGDVVRVGNFGNKIYFRYDNNEISYEELKNL